MLAPSQVIIGNIATAKMGPKTAQQVTQLPYNYRLASDNSGVGFFTHDGKGVTFHDIFSQTMTAIRGK